MQQSFSQKRSAKNMFPETLPNLQKKNPPGMEPCIFNGEIRFFRVMLLTAKNKYFRNFEGSYIFLRVKTNPISSNKGKGI